MISLPPLTVLIQSFQSLEHNIGFLWASVLGLNSRSQGLLIHHSPGIFMMQLGQHFSHLSNIWTPSKGKKFHGPSVMP